MTTTFKARYKNGKLEPLEPVEFEEGETLSLLTSSVREDDETGDSADEFERLLAEARKSAGERTMKLGQLLRAASHLPENGWSAGNEARRHDDVLYDKHDADDLR